MKRIALLCAVAVCISLFAYSANSAPKKSLADVYETSVVFPAYFSVGDYIEFLRVVPLDASASGYYEVSMSYTRGNIAAAATHLASVSHSNPDVWRETGRINSNGYIQTNVYNFTVDCNSFYGYSRFRIRAKATHGVLSDPVNVHIKVRSINVQSEWQALNNTGNDLTVNTWQPMTDEWSLLMGNGHDNASAAVALHVKQNGNIGIGTRTPDAKLSVAGTITAQKIKVTNVPANTWPDYVFDSSYVLPDLKEVAKFIKEHKHLPEVPSAKAVENDGLDVAEINKKLLLKIEELTLYLIEERSQRVKLESALRDLERRVAPVLAR
ncbi:tail fiber protein [uncultured Chitinophaga sp.]|uniref:tail fiber protein n=1 Tax=uncultured Chitinophaga sp. TaxID=339340 RepID=UPI0025D4636C|nr:tail fiber protein [uncultured Chitinophaga sp.]